MGLGVDKRLALGRFTASDLGALGPGAGVGEPLGEVGWGMPSLGWF